MIVFSLVCDFCATQIEVPSECDEDQFSWKRDKGTSPDCKSFGISLQMIASPIKSYEWHRNNKAKNEHKIDLTFCSRDCVLEYIKKNVSEDGKITKK